MPSHCLYHACTVAVHFIDTEKDEVVLDSDLLYLHMDENKIFFNMKEIKTEDQKKDFKNWILPGNSLSQDEFLSGILKAEEGPFFTVQESMENFEQWMKSIEKK